MKKPSTGMIIQPHGEITNSQTPLAQALRNLHPIPRLAFGLIGCAAISVYAPMLVLTLTGKWVNFMLGQSLINAACIAVVALVTLAANKVGRVMLVSAALALAFDLYWTSLSVRIYTGHDWWRYGWPNYFDVTAVFLLNGFLFLRYKQAADL